MKKYISIFALIVGAGLPVSAAQHNWAQRVLTSVNAHPVISEATHELESSKYFSQAMAQPIFNPELEVSVEQEGSVTNYQLGISSQLDWWDTSTMLGELGRIEYTVAELDLALIRNELLAEFITAQLEVKIADQALVLASEQVELSLAMLSLAVRQLNAGQANDADVADAKASLANAMVEEIEVQNAAIEAHQVLANMRANNADVDLIPADFWQPVPIIRSPESLPAVKQAHLLWLASKQQAQVARYENKSTPSVGIGAGKQDGENIITLNVSMPLQIRNNYADANNGFAAQSMAAEMAMKNVMLSAKNELNATEEKLVQTRKRYQQWKAISNNDFDKQIDTLRGRYTSGDLSMSAYQNQIQQLHEGKRAELALEAAFKQTHIDYLRATAQLPALLNTLANKRANQ